LVFLIFTEERETSAKPECDGELDMWLRVG
jgi:hypothetical protein